MCIEFQFRNRDKRGEIQVIYNKSNLKWSKEDIFASCAGSVSNAFSKEIRGRILTMTPTL